MIIIKLNRKNEYQVHINARNGEPLAVSEGFKKIQGAFKNAVAVCKQFTSDSSFHVHVDCGTFYKVHLYHALLKKWSYVHDKKKRKKK